MFSNWIPVGALAPPPALTPFCQPPTDRLAAELNAAAELSRSIAVVGGVKRVAPAAKSERPGSIITIRFSIRFGTGFSISFGMSRSSSLDGLWAEPVSSGGSFVRAPAASAGVRTIGMTQTERSVRSSVSNRFDPVEELHRFMEVLLRNQNDTER